MGQEDDEAVVLRIEVDDSEEEILVPVEDEDEWERVAEVWEEILAEELEEALNDEDFEDE